MYILRNLVKASPQIRIEYLGQNDRDQPIDRLTKQIQRSARESEPGRAGDDLYDVVVDASVLVDVLLNPQRASRLAAALGEAKPVAPAHVDAEVASALAGMHRAGDLTPDQVEQRLGKLAEMTIDRRYMSHLLTRAWGVRDNVSMLDALYTAFAEEAETRVHTTGARLSRAHPRAALVDWQEVALRRN